MIKRNQLETYLNGLLKPEDFNDYVPNGLQIEGKENIKSIISSPSISMGLIDKAVESKSDAILVHHGFFWKSNPVEITGEYKKKIKKILENEINLFAYHLPLDFHGTYGNNKPVLHSLGGEKIEPFLNIGYKGILKKPLSCDEFFQKLNVFYNNEGTHLARKGKVSRVAIVSGNGTSFFQNAVDENMDAFITGEGTEWIYQISKDSNVAFSAMGHYKSECIGVDLLGKHLAKKYKIAHTFFEEENPF